MVKMAHLLRLRWMSPGVSVMSANCEIALPQVANVLYSLPNPATQTFSMWQILRAGAFGGAAPHLTRVFGYCVSSHTLEGLPGILSMGIFCFGLVGFAGVGAFLAHYLGETTRKGAFFVGVAAPALIGNFVTAVQDARSHPAIYSPSKISMPFLFTSPARADERTDAEQQAIAKILFDPETAKYVTGGSKVSILAKTESATKLISHVCFMSRNNLIKFNEALKGKDTPEINCLDQEFIQPKQNAFSSLIVPVGATAVMINGVLFSINKPELTIGIDVTAGPTLAGDLLWALGGRRTEAITKSTVKELSK
jgi:hypothetical protein